MRVIRLNDEEISKRLSVISAGLVMLIKSGKMKEVYMDVEKKAGGTYHGRKLSEISFAPNME